MSLAYLPRIILANIDNCIPNERLDSVADINLEELYGGGKRNLVLDWDGTADRYHTYTVPVEKTLRDALKIGFNIAIHSNCTLQGENEIKQALRNRGFTFPVVRAEPKKPLPGAYTVLEHKTGFSQAYQTIFVGDRVITDIFGANQAGYYTILVKGFPERDPFKIRIAKKLDDILLQYAHRKRDT